MELNAYIDHTLLKAEAGYQDIISLCAEAEQYKFAAVCVNPSYVDLCAHVLRGTGVKVATVIGFPLGATLPAVKAFEAKEAILRHADELDMVIHIGAAKAGRWDFVLDEIRQVKAEAGSATLKVIIETALLSQDEKKRACETVLESGAQFIKTSTGFGPGGAVVEDIRLFRSMVGTAIGIKASGGIRTREQAQAMIAAGATRIGTSNGPQLLK